MLSWDQDRDLGGSSGLETKTETWTKWTRVHLSLETMVSRSQHCVKPYSLTHIILCNPSKRVETCFSSYLLTSAFTVCYTLVFRIVISCLCTSQHNWFLFMCPSVFLSHSDVMSKRLHVTSNIPVFRRSVILSQNYLLNVLHAYRDFNLNQSETKRYHFDEKLTMLTHLLFAVANHLVFCCRS